MDEHDRPPATRRPTTRIDPSAQAIADNSPDNIMLLDLDGRIQYINWTVPDLTPAGVIGTPVTTYVAEFQRDNILRCLDRVRATRTADRYETQYVASDGELSFWESRVGPVLRDDVLVGFTVISSNVTERRKAAADRDRFFNLSLDILAILDGRGHVIRINPACESTLGHGADDLIGRPLFELVHPADHTLTTRAIEHIFRERSPHDFANRLRRADGVYRTIAWRAILDPERRVFYGVGRDITDQAALEAQAHQAQRLDAIGQLAGGIAHDFNNLALVIQSNARFALTEPDDTARREYLIDIGLAAQRAADLTGQLLAFARRQPVRAELLDVNQLVRELLKMLRRLIPASIVVESHALCPQAIVRADRSQLEQVVLNLCLNARDAMPDGGTLTFETSTALLEELAIEGRPPLQAGSYARIAVRDTGTGMTPEVRARVFEPFFTTKETGRGTGLGLSTVYGVVHAHDGTVRVTSEPGHGSTFEVYLPLATHGCPDHPRSDRREIAGGTETLLIGEDDDAVRRVVVRTLEAAGYSVHTARDGIEAIAVFRQHRNAIALALLDVVMPRAGGIEACEQIRRERADLPIILTTGYSDVEQTTAVKPSAILHKPYDPDDLLRQVRALLDERRARGGPPAG